MDRALASDRKSFFRQRPGGLGFPRLTRLTWGVGLLAVALLGAAVNTGNNLLYLLFGLLLATLPVSLAASWLNLSRLTAELVLPPSPRAGAPFTLEVRLGSNRRRIAASSMSVQVITRRREHGPALVERILPGETIRVRLPADPARRGPLAVVGIRLESSFPLGLLKRARFFPVNRELLVLPGSSPAVMQAVAADADPGDAGHAAAVPGQEFEGLRRGREEDDARRIDWKSTARRGHPMVRETTGEGRPHVRAELVTRRRGSAAGARAVFEEEVSRVAGLAGAALRASGVVHLSIDGGADETFSGRWGHRALLHRLARLVPTDEDGRRLPPLPAAGETDDDVQESRASDLRATPPGRAHRASCFLALAVGTAALFAYDGLGLPSFTILAAALALAALAGDRVITRGPILVRLWKAGAFLALVAYFVDLIVVRHNPLQASLGLVVFITLFKLFNSKNVRDDRQLLLISLLQMIMAAALTTGVSFIVPLIVWVVAAVHAQVAWTTLPSRSRLALFVGPAVPSPHAPGLFSRGAVRYAMPTARVVAGLLVTGAAIFLLVPHLGTGTFAPGPLRGMATTGFSESTSLGDIGRIKLNTSRVMEVRVAGPGADKVELKWRGMALDRFDGRTWTRSVEAAGWSPADPGLPLALAPGPAAARPDPGLRLVQEIRLEPRSGRVVFAASRPVTMTFHDYLLLAQDPAGSVFLPQPPRRKLNYTVESQPPPFDPAVLRRAAGNDPAAVRHLYLRLPPLDDRIAALARRLTAAATTRHDAALAIEQWLSTSLRYSLNVNDHQHADPLAAFLFDDMAAHCEYFATAMVVLARSVDIPTRFVAGYLRGEQNRFSRGYTVRQSDAHSWVEVYFPQIGWVGFDPTPPAGRGGWDDAGWLDLPRDIYASVARLWDDYVIGIDLGDQARLYLFLRDTLLERIFALRAVLITGPGLKITLVAGILTPWLLWFAASRLRRYRTRRKTETVDLRAAPPFYRQMLRFLARRGLVRQAGETPGEFATRAARVLPRVAAGRIRDLTDLYHRIRFDPGDGAGASRTLARRLLADLRREAGYPRQPAGVAAGRQDA